MGRLLVHACSYFLFQRSISESSKYSTVKDKFEWPDSEKRNGYFGGNILFNGVLKSQHDCTLDVKLPSNFELFHKTYGFTILSQGCQFVKWHSDWEDAADSFISLHGLGSKLWFLMKPGKSAAMAEKLAKDPKDMIAQLSELTDKVSIAFQKPGDTLYLPFGYHHAVVTFSLENEWTFLLSVSTIISSERAESAWSSITQGATGERRSTRRQLGPQEK